MAWIIILITLVIILFILLWFRLKIKIHYCFQKNNHHLLISVYYTKLRLLHRKIDLNGDDTEEFSFILEFLQEVTEDKLTGFKDMVKNILGQLKLAKNMVTIMLKKITFQELNWNTHIGTGDASTTGLVTGGVWMIKGGLLGFVSELSNVDCKPNLAITPHFQQKGLFSQVDCIVTIRLGKAIFTTMRVIRIANIFPASKWQIDS
ncbi:DUF2953 domain-containing protein [Ornithinibacillus scapharcae]|uniref:DUF2953 domain-containing protein n=1 Tax=Ornithinibacillus scapharcae TaxID=1147159 RepID=UPI000225C196|nr:DUF2953 domain-containing protein [Ornithinibacillus scapharcae]